MAERPVGVVLVATHGVVLGQQLVEAAIDGTQRLAGADTLEQNGADAGEAAVELGEDGVRTDGARVADVGAEAAGGGGQVQDQRHAVGERRVGREEPGPRARARDRLREATIVGDPVRAEQGAPAEPGEGLVENLVDSAGDLGHLEQGADLGLGHTDLELRLDLESDVVGQALHLAELIELRGRIGKGGVTRQNRPQSNVGNAVRAPRLSGGTCDTVSPIVSPRLAPSSTPDERWSRLRQKELVRAPTRASVSPPMAANGASVPAGTP